VNEKAGKMRPGRSYEPEKLLNSYNRPGRLPEILLPVISTVSRFGEEWGKRERDITCLT